MLTFALITSLLAAPSLEPDPLEYDFGTVSTMPHTWVWTARNTGDTPLTITAPGCDCRAAGFILPKGPIAPGASDTISFALNLKSREYGPGAKSLQLKSTDPAHADFTIVARWNYEPPVICDPPDARFSDLSAGVAGEAYITILSQDPSFRVESVTTTAPTVTFEKTDDTTPSDRPRYPGREVWRARVSAESPTGIIEAPLIIRATARPAADAAPAEYTLEGHVSANIRSRLSITPRLFRINPATPGAHVESAITITAPGNQPFEITESTITDCDLEGFTVKAEPAENNARRLVLTGPAGDAPGLFRGTVRFVTTVPHESPINIPFNVIVRAAK